MKKIATFLLSLLFQFMGSFSEGLSNIEFLDDTVFSVMDSLSTAIKPIGYVLLTVFVMLEFTSLTEKLSHISGDHGLTVVLEIMLKFVLCKIVIDNSTEICQFVIRVTDNIAQRVTGVSDFTVITQSQLQTYMDNVFPEWYDLPGKFAMFGIIAVFGILSLLCLAVVYVIFYARIVELYVYTAVSPIPLSTCLSKSFNVAPNYLKNLFAVGLQGTLLILVVKIFNLLTVRELRSIINGTSTSGNLLSFITAGTESFSSCLHLLISTLFMSILMLVCAMQTQRWAKSICHAI